MCAFNKSFVSASYQVEKQSLVRGQENMLDFHHCDQTIQKMKKKKKDYLDSWFQSKVSWPVSLII